MKVFLSGTGYQEEHFSELKKKGFEIIHWPEKLDQKEFDIILEDCDAYVLGGDEKLTKTELQKAKKLKLISFVGTGYTSFIDEKSAKKQNISIANTPGINAPAVAEHTVGLLLGLQRKLFQHNWEVKNSCHKSTNSDELSSICVGIIGMGQIASRVARILRNCSSSSKVIYYSRSRKKNLETELSIEYVSLDTLLSSADAIVLSIPTNEETKHILNDSAFSKMKEGVIIVNAAGAHLIDPEALKKNIKNNKVSVAAFDGYYIEPLPKVSDDPFGFLSMSDAQFVITPHTAAKTKQTWNRMIDMAIKNVTDFF